MKEAESQEESFGQFRGIVFEMTSPYPDAGKSSGVICRFRIRLPVAEKPHFEKPFNIRFIYRNFHIDTLSDMRYQQDHFFKEPIYDLSFRFHLKHNGNPCPCTAGMGQAG